jgi:hypothetical protein
MANVIVRADGAYVVVNGQEVYLDGVTRVTNGGGVVVRFPARDVTVVEPMTVGRHLDCSDFQKCLFAVMYCGVTLAQIAAIRPAMAAAVQTFMTNNLLVANTVD